MDEKDIGIVMDSLIDGFEKDFADNKEYDFLRTWLDKPIDDFESYNVLNIFPIEQVIESKLIKFGNKRYALADMLMDYNFYESNLKFFINKRESFTFESDKTRWLIRSYIKYLETGDLPDMTVDEKCYWKPSFWSAIEWFDFIEALQQLKSGRPEKYLACLVEFSKL